MDFIKYSAVITTTPRRFSFLERAVQSILKQKVPAQEIIIVVDRHKDNKIPNLKGLDKDDLSKLKIIMSSGRGISSARNTGIKNASCDWIAFLDDDDLWLANKMLKQAETISKAKADPDKFGYKISHCNEKWLRNGKHLNQMKKHHKQGGDIYENCLELCCISPSSVVVHKSIFDKYGYFDEKMAVCEDFDLWLRIAAYEQVLFCEDVLVIKHGGHRDQLSKAYWGMDRFRVYAAQKMLADENLPSRLRELTQKSIKKRLTILAEGAQKRNRKLFASYYSCLLAKNLEKDLPRLIYLPPIQ